MTEDKRTCRLLHCAVKALAVVSLIACATVQPTARNERFYHCVETSRPIPPPNTFAKKTPLERLEYGDYVVEDRPTVGHSGTCTDLLLPKEAFIRYRYEGQAIERRFDLSALTESRVRRNTIQFYVDEDHVEMRLVIPVPGALPRYEVIAR
jgi:hypothetical protein